MASQINVPPAVIKKLVIFTGAMIIAPIASFFIVQSVFGGNAIVSGGIAAFVANVVLIGYVVVAFTEELPKEDVVEQKETKQD